MKAKVKGLHRQPPPLVQTARHRERTGGSQLLLGHGRGLRFPGIYTSIVSSTNIHQTSKRSPVIRRLLHGMAIRTEPGRSVGKYKECMIYRYIGIQVKRRLAIPLGGWVHISRACTRKSTTQSFVPRCRSHSLGHTQTYIASPHTHTHRSGSQRRHFPPLTLKEK